ncbi:hypothetical protein MG293_012155 [Ovis ammon polii]|uniref:CD82 antigen n=1 Tax=Ovis ammon polii TaxID=230172 RepID=A0AAD4U2V8_OVIAM|nr:hypothetical protein MG293_012155 [Ovis ammon polii]
MCLGRLQAHCSAWELGTGFYPPCGGAALPLSLGGPGPLQLTVEMGPLGCSSLEPMPTTGRTVCAGIWGSSRTDRMGSACIKVTKYFLFLFNLLFFVLGAVILGFGIWILVDKNSFISILQTSSSSFKVAAYVFISVGALTMLMGFLGCLGAVNEVRCLLGMYFAFLLLILIAQVTAGVFFYFNMGQLKQEMGSIVTKLIHNYTDGSGDGLQEAWDYVQAQVKCCGWVSFLNWTENTELMNRANITFPCSCKKSDEDDTLMMPQKGFCEAPFGNGTQSGNNPEDWPVYQEGCMEKVQGWLQENLGVILGVCVGVAVIELLGMFLSMFLCRRVHSEDYSKTTPSLWALLHPPVSMRCGQDGGASAGHTTALPASANPPGPSETPSLPPGASGPHLPGPQHPHEVGRALDWESRQSEPRSNPVWAATSARVCCGPLTSHPQPGERDCSSSTSPLTPEPPLSVSIRDYNHDTVKPGPSKSGSIFGEKSLKHLGLLGPSGSLSDRYQKVLPVGKEGEQTQSIAR